jgi:F-type H+-transporting ATPase subunit b
MEILKEFGVQPILLLAQVVNFLVLIWLLKRFLYKPVLKVLEERKKQIETSVLKAEEINLRLTEIDSKQNQILKSAHLQASKIIEDAKINAREISEKMITDTKIEAENIILTAAKQAQIENEVAKKRLKNDISALVVKAVSALTGKILDQKDHQKLILESLKESNYEKRDN